MASGLHHSQSRLHSALGYRTPEEFAKTSDGDCGKDGLMLGLLVRPARSGLQQAFTLPAPVTRHHSARWCGL